MTLINPIFSEWKSVGLELTITVGRALANGFPLTEFGGFQGPFSVNSKYFNAFESRLVEDQGKNNNSSSILYNFAT